MAIATLKRLIGKFQWRVLTLIKQIPSSTEETDATSVEEWNMKILFIKRVHKGWITTMKDFESWRFRAKG